MPNLRPYAYVGAMAVTGLVAVARAALVCEAPVSDFGIRHDTEGGLSHTFEVRNAGDAAVAILAVRSTCDCLTTEMARRTLQPGERVPVDVHFRFGSLAGAQHRVIHLVSRPEGDSSASPQVLSLTLKGTILPPVLRVPDVVDLGVILPGRTVTGTIHLVSGRAGPFALRAVGLRDAAGRADYGAGHTATSHTVRLIVPPPDRFGPFSGLALATTDLDAMPQVPIAYRGRVAPLIEAIPPFIGVSPDQRVDTHVAIFSAHRIPFVAVSVQATDPQLSARLSREGEVWRIHVASEAPGREFADALVRVATDHPQGRFIEIPVRIVESPKTQR